MFVLYYVVAWVSHHIKLCLWRARQKSTSAVLFPRFTYNFDGLLGNLFLNRGSQRNKQRISYYSTNVNSPIKHITLLNQSAVRKQSCPALHKQKYVKDTTSLSKRTNIKRLDGNEEILDCQKAILIIIRTGYNRNSCLKKLMTEMIDYYIFK